MLRFEKQGKGIDSFEVAEFLAKHSPDKIFVEEIPAMPRQGVKSLATQWFVVGQCHTLATLYCEHVEYIPASRWTSFTKRLAPIPGKTSKEVARELAIRFFPDFSKRFTKRKLHDGIADCLCILMYIDRDKFIDFLQR
jgi:hypothetical protein